jgi:hypothetical protein
MIVWVASFPRSGNTFLRIALHRTYGLRSATVYDVDGVAERVGRAFVGFDDEAASDGERRASAVAHLVKTHRQRDDQIRDEDRSIVLVRDGRDALVSWARQRSEHDPTRFEVELRGLIGRDEPSGTGSWGANVLSWLSDPPTVLLRFEDLVADPTATVRRAVAAVLPDQAPVEGGVVPSFAELHAHDDRFFRRGRTGSHRDELPPDLADAFWAKADNATAMAVLGYGDGDR